jgi:hypothetical protein
MAPYVAAAAVINPLREYAFADDWAYALTVRHLVETGQYQLSPWAAPYAFSDH